jgi:hypothetical protein
MSKMTYMLQLLGRMPQLLGHRACHVFSDGGRRNLAAGADLGPWVLRSTLRSNRRHRQSVRHRTRDNSQLPHIRPCIITLSIIAIAKNTHQRGNHPRRCPCQSRHHLSPLRRCAPMTAAFAPSLAQPRAACPRWRQQPSHLPKTCWARERPASQLAVVCRCQRRWTSRLPAPSSPRG